MILRIGNACFPHGSACAGVERVQAPLEEIDGKINEALRRAKGETLHDLALARDDAGAWHAFLTLSRQA